MAPSASEGFADIAEVASAKVRAEGGCGLIYGSKVCTLPFHHSSPCGPHGPSLVCSKCGMDEEDSEWGMLIPVRVIVNPGEEGYSEIVQLLCDGCFPPIREGLIALGFVQHHHGSTDFLSDPNCPGDRKMADCPTPHDYGSVVVQPSGPVMERALRRQF